MAKVDKGRMLRKGLMRGLQYAAVAMAALATVEVPPDIGVTDQASIVFGIAVIGAVGKAIQNYRKTKKRAGDLRSASGLLVCVSLALGGLLAGCVATQGQDGTWRVEVDRSALDATWDRYEAMERRKTDLEKERKAASLQRKLAIDTQLREMKPEIQELADVLGIGLSSNPKTMGTSRAHPPKSP